MDSVKFARKSAKYRPGDFRTITSQPVNCQLHNEKQWSFGLEHSSNTGSTFNRRKHTHVLCMLFQNVQSFTFF